MSIVNLAAYRFVTLNAIQAWRPLVAERCAALGLRGTILLAPEGINLFVAGTREAADAFIDYIRHDALFEGKFSSLAFKESLSPAQPFRRMLVKLKREIITMKKPAIQPELGRAPAVDAATLKRWLDSGHDDAGRPVVMLDTRNAFEVDVGTFDDAIDYRIAKFSEFPEAVAAHRDALAD
ncbi:MAG TPA: sulfurtransferase, partial [Casimicrobiaceae bacterium]|nr:sulfurtransferase [Casimicrobiaceae bacterium]